MVNTQSSAPILEALPNDARQGSVSSGVPGRESGLSRRRPSQRIEALHVAFLRRGLHVGVFPVGLRDSDVTSLRVVA
jgi:hypothetical protein